MKKIIFLILVFFAWKHFYYVADAPELGPGAVAGGYPYQNSTSTTSFRKGDYTYSPRASYEVEARVISASRYYFDQEARISPIDLALGWGPMSDESILKDIDVWQEKRWYKWEADALPIPKYEVVNNSANVHIIPGNESIAEEVKKIRNGDIVQIKGYLVDVKKSTGWKWKTSMVRDDEGIGACEIIYVNSLTIVDPYERLYY
ncbi:MAG: hypothetical protein U9N57_03995 [Pseudomonadota bacterium]|nr:hypothetical protein [Pseudomonadota bacterium]